MKSWIKFLALAAITILLCIAIAFNLSPYLRGPAPYYPDWRWIYLPSNTLNKLWAPLICISTILFIAYRTEEKKLKTPKQHPFWLLFLLVLLGFLLQLSLLFYSRAGLNVIVNRIINPYISGYFTTALKIHSIPQFLHTFTTSLGGYAMYAKFHPPAADLFFLPFLYIFSIFSSHFLFLNHLTPAHNDVAKTWSNLLAYQKAAAVFSGIFIAFLANSTIIPLYYSAKFVYGSKVAMRSSLLFLFIPSVLLFTPLNDAFLPLLTASFLYLFIFGLYHSSRIFLFFAGALFCISIYFSLAFLPLGIFLFLFIIFYTLQKTRHRTLTLKLFLFFLAGFLLIPTALFLLLGFNSIDMAQKVMWYHEAALHERKYSVWLFYNLYDFFLFLGIPLALLYSFMIYKNSKTLLSHKLGFFKRIDSLFLAFTITLLIVDISGTARGETARIWTPYLPLVILFLANYITKEIITTKWQFIVLLLLQAAQLVLFQSVLVTIS